MEEGTEHAEFFRPEAAFKSAGIQQMRFDGKAKTPDIRWTSSVQIVTANQLAARITRVGE